LLFSEKIQKCEKKGKNVEKKKVGTGGDGDSKGGLNSTSKKDG